MTSQSTEYYVRQASIQDFGPEGIAKLRGSTIAVAGVGGVGSAAAYYLARSGVGGVRLIDQDIIEPSNLARMSSATREDLYHPKAETLAGKLSQFDSSSKILPLVDTITDRNVDELLKGVDLILDGLDNFRTRYVLNRFALRNKVPYMFVSAVAEQAHFALLNPPNTPCLECIMPRVSDRFADSCETLGVTPAITGIAGAIGAETAIKFLVSGTSRLADEMLTVDMTRPEFVFSKLSKKKTCRACNNSSNPAVDSDSRVRLLCGEHTANILPPKAMNIQLLEARATMPATAVIAGSESHLVYREGPYIVTVFPNGRLLIGQIDDVHRAREIATRVWRSLAESETLNLKSEARV